MKAPIPVDQLPSFNATANKTDKPGSNSWVEYLIVGGIIVVSLATGYYLANQKMNQILNLKDDEKQE